MNRCRHLMEAEWCAYCNPQTESVEEKPERVTLLNRVIHQAYLANGKTIKGIRVNKTLFKVVEKISGPLQRFGTSEGGAVDYVIRRTKDGKNIPGWAWKEAFYEF